MAHSEHSLEVYRRHYYLRDNEGQFLEDSPQQVNQRVANWFIEMTATDAPSLLNYVTGTPSEELIKLQNNQQFLFNSPIYYNAIPTKNYPQFAALKRPRGITVACFVGDLQDSMDSISRHADRFLRIFKQGAGIGVNLNLRPSGASVGDGGLHNVGETGSADGLLLGSSGAMSYARFFNYIGETVRSGGRRRAAIMFIMNDTHPDLLEFISCKDPEGDMRKHYECANLSVAVSDAFIIAAGEHADWSLRWQDKTWSTHDAAEILEEIAYHAWKGGCPGMFFIDTANRYNTTPLLGKIVCTNPCGEIPLPPSMACNLGSLNLYKLLGGVTHGSSREILHNAVNTVMPFLDANIDLTVYPDAAFRENSLAARPTGLGIMGLGELLYAKGMRYGSDEAITLAAEIMEEITLSAYEWSVGVCADDCMDGWRLEPCPASQEPDNVDAMVSVLARMRDASKKYGATNYGRWQRLIADVRQQGAYRNSYVTCIAPTGNTGVAGDAISGSGEPVYGLTYTRTLVHDTDKRQMEFVDPELLQAVRGLTNRDEVLAAIADNGGSVQGLPNVPVNIRDTFVTAPDLHYLERLKMQAAMQSFTSLAISSTLNLPEETEVDDIIDIFVGAHALGLKGVTVFRDECLEPYGTKTPLSHSKTDEKCDSKTRQFKVADTRYAVRRIFTQPERMPSETFQYVLSSGVEHYKLYITIGEDPETIGKRESARPTQPGLQCGTGRPVAVFLACGDSGDTVNSLTTGIAKLISGWLQDGAPIQEVIRKIKGLRGATQSRVRLMPDDEKSIIVFSIPDVIGRLLERLYVSGHTIVELPNAAYCPECSNKTFVFEAGCWQCKNPRCKFMLCE